VRPDISSRCSFAGIGPGNPFGEQQGVVMRIGEIIHEIEVLPEEEPVLLPEPQPETTPDKEPEPA